MKDIVQHVEVYPADINTPISLYLKFIGEKEGILLESAEVDGRLGRYSLLAWDFLFEVIGEDGKAHIEIQSKDFDFLKDHQGEDLTQALKSIIKRLNISPTQKALPTITRSLIGFMGYECACFFEPVLCNCLSKKEAKVHFVFPGRQILFDHLHHRCFYISVYPPYSPETTISPLESNALDIGKITTSFSREEFIRAVKEVKEMIHSGEAIQVVLSTRFSSSFSGNPFTLYRRLRQTNPSPYMFFINFKEVSLIGSSPELMVRSRNGTVEVRPIAGTRPRGKDEKEDRILEEELLRDPKERAEHLMLVDLGRNDLGRIATAGSVEVEKFMEVEKFSHVMHLTSYVSARLKEEVDGLDIIASTFPAGTVSGAPKIRAMEIIAEREPISRGPYAGAIGWIGMGQDCSDVDMGIIIRSTWIEGDKIHWQAGAGIVADSIPEKEWEECHNKARVIDRILKQEGEGDVFAHR